MPPTKKIEKVLEEQECYLGYEYPGGYYEARTDFDYSGGWIILHFACKEEFCSQRLEFSNIQFLANFMRMISGDLRKWKKVIPTPSNEVSWEDEDCQFPNWDGLSFHF